MTARKKKNFNGRRIYSKKGGDKTSPFQIGLVNLKTVETTAGQYFLGFKLVSGNYNQLWRWDDLSDVKF